MSLHIEGIEGSIPPIDIDYYVVHIACRISNVDIKIILYCKRYLQVQYSSVVVKKWRNWVIQTIWENMDGTASIIFHNRWYTTIKLRNWKMKANHSDKIWPFYYSGQYDTLYRSYKKKSCTVTWMESMTFFELEVLISMYTMRFKNFLNFPLMLFPVIYKIYQMDAEFLNISH